MSMKGTPSNNEDGTNDEQSANKPEHRIQRGNFKNLYLGESAPEHLADFLATLGDMRFEYTQATFDNPSSRYVVDFEPTDECPPHLEDRVGDTYYELEEQELPDGRIAVRFGRLEDRDDGLWVIGHEDDFDRKFRNAAVMDNTQQNVTTYRAEDHDDLVIRSYNWFADIIFQAAKNHDVDFALDDDIPEENLHKTVDIRGYQYAFYNTNDGLYMPLGECEQYGTAGVIFDPDSLDETFTAVIEDAASRASFYEEPIRLEVAETDADRPISKKQADGTVETLERGDELSKPWVETEHERVYYASDDDQNPEFKPASQVTRIGAEIADAFPDWDVVMTTGFREYAISYNIRYDLGVIHLDVDNIMPAHEHVARTARDIHRGLNEGDT
jgi:hypothetical protein